MDARYRDPMTASPAKDRRREDLERRLRAAFVQGAEEDSQHRLGGGLTQRELRGVLRRFPGNSIR